MILNNHFVSIGQTTNSIHKGLSENSTITEIIRYFKEHSSIKTINNFLTKNSILSLKPITKERQIIVKLNHKKAHGPDMIHGPDIILQPLLNIINKCIIQGFFPNFLKKAIVSPLYKKKDSFNKENYRPISLLTTFSKVFEKAIELQLSPILEEQFSKFLCTYRKQFSSQHTLLDLLKTGKQNWKGTNILALSLWICQKPFTVYQKTYF